MSTLRITAPSIDAAVPALDHILDVDRLGGWLRAHGQALVARPYLRYKPDTSCVAALELETGRAFVYGVAEPVRPKLDKLVAKAPPGSVLAVDHDRRMVLATVAADRDLPALRDVPGAVARLGLDRGLDSTAELSVLVHKPQRRLVGLLGGRPDATAGADRWGDVVLRAYRGDAAPGALDRHLRAGRTPGLRTARVLASSRQHGLLALEHLPGQPLDALLASGTATPAVLRATGRALASLHAVPSGSLDPSRASTARAVTVSASARETAELVGRICPGLADRMAAVLQGLAVTAPDGNGQVLCHGDFSADQVIVDSHGHPGLIDWDRSGVADPATDLAAAQAAGLADGALSDLLDGYRLLRPVPGHLDWHLVQARLMRAADPFRAGAVGWPDLVEAQVAAMEQLLDRVPGQRG
jgi:aminoglycoside phosphotransferase